MKQGKPAGTTGDVPKVSVIMPTYNKAEYLDLSLASWCHQSFTDYELIVVNDGARDATPDVLRKYEARLPIRCIAIENVGRAGARNCGLRVARGAIIVFCDDDRVV